MIKHKVSSGDTLSQIALHYYGDSKVYPLLSRANGIKDPNRINVGDIINIPERLYEKDEPKHDGNKQLLVLKLYRCLEQEPKCSIILDNDNLTFCGTKNNKTIQATGDPAGGSYTFKISDNSIARVSNTDGKIDITPLKVGCTDISVIYKKGNVSNTKNATIKVCTCTPGRKYANAYKSMNKLVGIKGKIKTRHGKISGEEMKCDKVSAYYVAYVNISSDISGTLVWAQSGFGRERTAGSAEIKAYRYAEMKGNTYKVKYDNSNAPLDKSDHTYECILDEKSGKWSFYQDGENGRYLRMMDGKA